MSSLAGAFTRLRPGRTIHGVSAVLLPFTREGEIDWGAFERHLIRTREAGLDVAVNMDTGFGDLLAPYGSDYLLGLSTFAPEDFAARDLAFARDDVEFLARNDALQHLGNVGFRAPVPAYKHSAAQYLHITGHLECDSIHPRAPRRPASDRSLLLDCALRLGAVRDTDRTFAERVQPFLGS